MGSFGSIYGEANTLHPHLLNFVQEQHSAQNSNPVVICLANYLPLIRLAQQSPKLARSVTVLGYLSVNLRWTKAELSKTTGETNAEVMNIINTSFANFVAFETFGAFRETNSANVENTPELSLLFEKSLHPYISFVKKQIHEWNSHMTASCIRDLRQMDTFKNLEESTIELYKDELQRVASDSSLPGGVRADAKILNNIHEHPHQFVFADVGLIVALVGKSCSCFKHVELQGETFISTSVAREHGTAYYYTYHREDQTSPERGENLRLFGRELTQFFTEAGYAQ
jgi:hypothetical protein